MMRACQASLIALHRPAGTPYSLAAMASCSLGGRRRFVRAASIQAQRSTVMPSIAAADSGDIERSKPSLVAIAGSSTATADS